MSDTSFNYVTRSGRNSRQIRENLNFSSRQNRVRCNTNTSNMVLFHDEDGNQNNDNNQQQNQQLQQRIEEQQNEIARQQREIATMRATINEQQNVDQLQQRIDQQNQELQRLQETIAQLPRNGVAAEQVNNANNVQGNAQQQPAPARDFTAEICAIMNNITSTQIEIKLPVFHDENTSNPLEFLENFERFCLTKNIADNNKLRMLNVALHGRARNWLDLQPSFDSFEQFSNEFQKEFYSTMSQIDFRDKWINKKFISKDDKSLKTYYYRQLKQATYLKPVPSEYEKNLTIIRQFPMSVRKSLALIDCNNSADLVKAIVSLDNLYNEKVRNFDQNYLDVNNTNENNVHINEFKVQNKHFGSGYRGRGNFRNYRGRGRWNNAYNPHHTNTENHEQSSNTYNQSFPLPDTRFPPPTNTNSATSNIQNSQFNLNDK